MRRSETGTVPLLVVEGDLAYASLVFDQLRDLLPAAVVKTTATPAGARHLACPGTAVVVLTGHDEEAYADQALLAPGEPASALVTRADAAREDGRHTRA